MGWAWHSGGVMRLGLIESSGSLKDGMGSVALHVWDAMYGMLRCQASLPIGRLLASGTRPMQDATIVDVCVLPVAGGSSSVFNKALNAFFDSMCTSSMM